MDSPSVEKTSMTRADGTVRLPGTDGQETEFRYAFQLNESKMRVWMEERKTKAQWMSEQLAVEDFAPSDGVIPGASVEVYFEKLARTMQTAAAEEAGSGSKRELVLDAETRILRLVITLTFTADDIRWEPAYEFKLMPVALKPMDVLAAKIEDLEVEVEMLKTLTVTKATGGAVFARATSDDSLVSESGNGSLIGWDITESAHGESSGWATEQGYIVIPEDGVYMITVQMSGECDVSAGEVVMKIVDDKGAELGATMCSFSKRHEAMHHVMTLARLSKGSSIAVEASEDFYVEVDESSLLIHLVR